ncbi:hypothetical protein [Aquimarina rubra]|uniref:OmpH family outer membrane protein n=1 Tax=Aquimarina rubra TaxID=1920033 RepID=A0ABW5LJV0_9FLAO
MKNILKIFILFLSTMAIAQNPLTQNMEDPQLEEEAKELTQKYDDQLGLTEKQILLFENKVEEYLINAKKIRNSNLKTKKKIAELKLNYAKESKDMGDILTNPQLDLYNDLKPKFQPINPVVVKKASN